MWHSSFSEEPRLEAIADGVQIVQRKRPNVNNAAAAPNGDRTQCVIVRQRQMKGSLMCALYRNCLHANALRRGRKTGIVPTGSAQAADVRSGRESACRVLQDARAAPACWGSERPLRRCSWCPSHNVRGRLAEGRDKRMKTI